MESLERRLGELRAEVRRAAASRDTARVRVLRAELRNAERDWDDALSRLEERQLAAADPAAPPVPLRTGQAGWQRPRGAGRCHRRGWQLLLQTGRCYRCGSRFTRR